MSSTNQKRLSNVEVKRCAIKHVSKNIKFKREEEEEKEEEEIHIGDDRSLPICFCEKLPSIELSVKLRSC
jgi:hypothetical protein